MTRIALFFALPVAATLALLCITISPTSGADITYAVIQYPSLQNENSQFPVTFPYQDTLSGTITTDGTIGAITGNDIVGVDLTLITSEGTFGLVSNQTPFLGATVVNQFHATPTQLQILAGDTLQLSDGGDAQGFGFGNVDVFDWFGTGVQGFPNGYYAGVHEFSMPGVIELEAGFQGEGIPPDSPWVIAGAVPEPASFILLALAAAGLLLCRRR